MLYLLMKEIGQRYDFKGSASKLERTEGGIILLSEDEMKAKQVLDILISNLIKRNVDPKVIKLKSSKVHLAIQSDKITIY